MDNFITLLYQAMTTKYGLVLETDNLPILRARLYKARAESGDPDLACLQLRPDPVAQNQYLWIIKGEMPNGA